MNKILGNDTMKIVWLALAAPVIFVWNTLAEAGDFPQPYLPMEFVLGSRSHLRTP